VNVLKLAKISDQYFERKKKFKFQVTAVFFILFLLIFFTRAFTDSFYETSRKIFSTKDNKYLTVIPKDVDLSYFKFAAPSFMGKGELKESFIPTIKKMQGVEDISPTYTIKAPANMYGDFFDLAYGTDLSVFGENAPFKKHKYNHTSLKVIPVVVSSKLLEIYNLSFAPANSLPKLTKKILIGRKFNIKIGANSFKTSGKVYEGKIKIVDLNDRVEFLGITMPEDLLKQLSDSIQAPVNLINFKIFAENASDLITVGKTLEQEGYKIKENENELFKTINRYLFRLQILVDIPVIFIMGLILMFVQNQLKYMLSVQKKEIGIQMAFGIYYSDLINIWLYQYTKLMLIALSGGYIFGYAVIKILFYTLKEDLLKNVVVISYHPGQLLLYSLIIVGFTVFYIHYTLKKYFRQNTIVNLIVQ